MTTKAIETDKAPAAVGPYSQAVAANGFLFTSGQLPIDPKLGKIPEGSIQDHAHIVFKNLLAVADAAGTGADKAVKVTVFLSDIGDFQAVNEVYKEYFVQPFPARSAFQVGCLPFNAAIEVEAVFAM